MARRSPAARQRHGLCCDGTMRPPPRSVSADKAQRRPRAHTPIARKGRASSIGSRIETRDARWRCTERACARRMRRLGRSRAPAGQRKIDIRRNIQTMDDGDARKRLRDANAGRADATPADRLNCGSKRGAKRISRMMPASAPGRSCVPLNHYQHEQQGWKRGKNAMARLFAELQACQARLHETAHRDASRQQGGQGQETSKSRDHQHNEGGCPNSVRNNASGARQEARRSSAGAAGRFSHAPQFEAAQRFDDAPDKDCNKAQRDQQKAPCFRRSQPPPAGRHQPQQQHGETRRRRRPGSAPYPRR